MGKKRTLREGRPEASGDAAEHYGQDAGRYHGANSQLQLELTSRALAMLALEQLEPEQAAGRSAQCPLLADIGVGSGLGSAALAGCEFVGLDIAPAMLALAGSAGCGGRLALADMAQGLPLRHGALDGAVSVSAVQWLCVHAQPVAAMGRLFAGLHAALRPGARAALQVYVEGDSQAAALLQAARSAGFPLAAFVVDFPHPTPAKKYSLCLHKLESTAAGPEAGPAREAEHGAAQPNHAHARWPACCLAWPRSGTCLLAWERYLAEQAGLATGQLEQAAARLQRQHATAGKHVLRLHRRAESMAAAAQGVQGSAPAGVTHGRQQQQQPEQQQHQDNGASGSAVTSSDAAVVLLEAEVVQREVQPCGGVVFVQLAAPQAWLQAEAADGGSAAGCSCAAQDQQPQVAGWAGCEEERLAQPLLAAAAQLLGPGSRLVASKAKRLGGEAAAQHCQPRRRPASPAGALPPPTAERGVVSGAGAEDQGAGVKGKAQQRRPYMWIEPLQRPAAGGDDVRSAEGSGGGLAQAAVLHAQKSAQHLVLRCSADSLGAASKQALPRLRALTARLDAALVAADVMVCEGGGGVEACWLLFVPDLEHADRGQVKQHVLTAFR